MSIGDIFSLFGGIGLFLYGMSIMSSGLRSACGDNLQKILEKATGNKVMAVLMGILVTMLIQSSSATDVMVIGFVSSGMMTLSQAIGVIMGANIGTTITAQITAFDLGTWAPLILFIGAVMYLFIKKQVIRHIGSIIMGFGMLFQGISFMKAAISPLSETQIFQNLLSALSNPFLIVLFGVAFTALLQSSSSATVIFQAFAAQGIISYYTCVYLIIGSAIGSVTPNFLASLTTNRNGKRTALLNLLFNLIRAALLMTVIGIFPQILDFIQYISGDDIARQVANTHTLFAIFAVVVMLPFSEYIVKLAQKLLPPRKSELQDLDDRELKFMTNVQELPTAVAISQAKKEIARMGAISVGNLALSLESFFELDEEKAARVLEVEETVNYLDNAIIAKLVQLRTMNISQRDMNRVYHLILSVADIERISDYAENISGYQSQIRAEKATMSEDARGDLLKLSELCLEDVNLCLEIFENDSFHKLHEVEELESEMEELLEEVKDNHVKRLLNATCKPIVDVIFTDLLTDLERSAAHADNVAYALSPQNGVSRLE
ncbi:MAG: Na/Pi cotransporter family protein [Lachnospiraceae bacterium]|nr:Na/Pi cotransporter family protein [Lachnospiraceae bacterium]